MYDISEVMSVEENLKANSKEHRWEAAEEIHTACTLKTYAAHFRSQTEYGQAIGLSSGRMAQYKNAYEYYLNHKSIINQHLYSVEHAYILHSKIGNNLEDFLLWLDKKGYNKPYSYSTTKLKNIICEYKDIKSGKEYEIYSKEEIMHMYEQLTYEHKKEICDLINQFQKD